MRVRSTDAGGLWFERALTVTVTDVNEAPTDLVLSNSSLAENEPVGTLIGLFSSTDPDAANTFTYTLVDTANYPDNAAFAIPASTNELRAAEIFNLEAQVDLRHSRADRDQGGLPYDEVLTITVLNVNDAPEDILLTNSTVDEGLASGTLVGDLVTVDEDAGGWFSYELATGGGDTDNASFSVAAGSDELRTAATFDYETQSEYSIRVRSTDQGGLWVEQVLTIYIGNVNLAPTDLLLSNASVPELQPLGTVAGTFSTVDPESPADPFTYELVAGSGDADNGSFTIDGDQLRTGVVFDYETRSVYSIRVRTTDAGGLWCEQDFTITITDVAEATLRVSGTNPSLTGGSLAAGRTSLAVSLPRWCWGAERWGTTSSSPWAPTPCWEPPTTSWSP